MKKLILILTLLLFAPIGWVYSEIDSEEAKSQATYKGPYDDETAEQRDARMAWWRLWRPWVHD